MLRARLAEQTVFSVSWAAAGHRRRLCEVLSRSYSAETFKRWSEIDVLLGPEKQKFANLRSLGQADVP